MAQPPPTQKPLDSLQGTMNALLTVLGHALQQPGRLRDPRERVKTQGIFPTANSRFHEALDRMETDINQAQAILRRDLALHRVMKRQEDAKARAKAEIKEEPAVSQEEDTIMLDLPTSSEQKKEKLVSSAPNKAPVAPMMVAAPAKAPAAATAPTRQMEPVQPKPQPLPSAAAHTQPVAPTTAVVLPTKVEQPIAPVAETKEEPAMPTSATGDLDFGSIFGDDIELGAGQGDDNGQIQSNDLDINADFGDSGADVSSLLPGLESYANIPDEPMQDMPGQDPPATGAGGDPNAVPDFDFGDLGTLNTGESNAQQDGGGDPSTEIPDFGDLGFDFESAGNGGASGEQGDNTFNDLFDMDDYGGMMGGGDSKGGQELDEWMNSL